jgi:predicted RNA-binding Zn-ribbon protein involved in translation (DUF1610 family)
MDVLESKQLLTGCTQCGAWPMAIVSREGGRLTFRCPKCRMQEVFRVGVAGRLIPAGAANGSRPRSSR